MRWQEWMDGVLRKRYAGEKNALLAEELGVSLRTLERHAGRLGLRKSESFLRDVSREGLMEVEYRRLCGERVGGVRKGEGRKGTAGSFAKGHHFCGEVEARRVKAIRDRAWDERVRGMRGWERRTKWKMSDYGKNGG